jgi:hypothetical protein
VERYQRVVDWAVQVGQLVAALRRVARVKAFLQYQGADRLTSFRHWDAMGY